MCSIAYFTDDTLTQLEEFSYLIIIFWGKGFEWVEKMWHHHQKWLCKSFQQPHLNQVKDSVLKQKNVKLLMCRYFPQHQIYFLKYSKNSYIKNHGKNFWRKGNEDGQEYLYICPNAYIYIYIYIYIYMHTYIYSNVHLHLHTNIYIYIG